MLGGYGQVLAHVLRGGLPHLTKLLTIRKKGQARGNESIVLDFAGSTGGALQDHFFGSGRSCSQDGHAAAHRLTAHIPKSLASRRHEQSVARIVYGQWIDFAQHVNMGLQSRGSNSSLHERSVRSVSSHEQAEAPR